MIYILIWQIVFIDELYLQFINIKKDTKYKYIVECGKVARAHFLPTKQREI